MTFCMNRSIRLIRSLFLLACVAAASPSYAQSSPPPSAADNKIRDIDGVAAVVNTGFVTRKEIDDRVATITKQGGGAAMPDKETLRKQVLERLIVEKIQLQDAEQSGINVSNAELDKIITTGVTMPGAPVAVYGIGCGSVLAARWCSGIWPASARGSGGSRS
jgi:peptidyl-prolyl cis-trans isomerase SurA